MSADFINEGLSEEERDAFFYWLQGNEAALEVCDLITSATHVWDDLVDLDQESPSAHEINSAFMALSIGLMKNEFFLAHSGELIPLLEQAMYDWIDSCQLEGEEKYLPAAFTLRCAFAGPMIKCFHIVGGPNWGMKASQALRRYLYDDWDDFVQEHGEADGLVEQQQAEETEAKC